jgi:hypothetical protein
MGQARDRRTQKEILIMTKKNDPDLLIAICDTLAGGLTLSLKEAARLNGTTAVSIWSWMQDPALIIPEYLGQQNITFGKAMKLARKAGVALAISETFENRIAVGGHFEKVWFQGQPTYIADERQVDLDEDMRLMLYGFRDGLKRDENGNRIQHSRFVPAPAQLIEKFIEANAPKLYGQKSQLTVDSKVNLGVTVIGERSRPLPQPVQVVTQQITETVAREALEAPDAVEQFEIEDAEPVEQYSAEPEAQGDEPEPEPVAPEPEPIEPVDGLSTEELELLRRARSPSPLIADLAARAAAKIAQGRSADNIGAGRTPGSGGRRTA